MADSENTCGFPLPRLQVSPGGHVRGHGGWPHLVEVLGGAGHGQPGGDDSGPYGGLLPCLSSC